MKVVLAVALGGFLGAPLRFHLDRLLRHGRFPWGTLTANTVGCFLLGTIAGRLEGTTYALLGIGFCGALTTFSTLGYETVRLLQDDGDREAVLSVVANVGAGVSATWLGWWLGGAL